MKRYKLIIPDMIPRVLLLEARLFSHLEGETYDLVNRVYVTDISDGQTHECPKEWLHEIEEEKPLYPVDWFLKTYGDDEIKDIDHGYFRVQLQKAFEAGEANNELKHRETVSCADAIRKDLKNPVNIHYHAWDACLKSHNITTEDE